MRLDLERVYILVFVFVFLLVGPGFLLGHKVKHDFPYGYLASDAFQHQTRADAIKDIGNFKHEAFYISHGFKSAVGRYPPILPHLSAMLSIASGLETYDAIILISFIFVIVTALVFYITIKQYSHVIAILSLPLSLLMLSKAPFTGFLWGHWPSFLGQFFLVAFIWSLSIEREIEKEKKYLLMAVFISGVALGHTIVLIPLLFILALYLLTKLLRKELNELKYVFYASIVSIAISFYYLIIFINSWAKGNKFAISSMPVWQGNPGFYFSNFTLLGVFIIIGLFIYIAKLKRIKSVAGLASLSLLAFGFSNYIGFAERAFQLRFFWPMYLSFLFGLGIYQIIKFIAKRQQMHYAFGIAFIFILGFAKIPGVLQIEKISGQGIMTAQHWQVLNWISKNTELNAKIYFFYGDIYSQDALLRNAKREHYLVDTADFVQAINERKIKRNYVTEMPGDGGGGTIYRKGFLKFGNYQLEKESEYFYGEKDICNFDYYVFDKATINPAFSSYNMLLASELLKKGSVVAFQNGISVILKHQKQGDDCIEERGF